MEFAKLKGNTLTKPPVTGKLNDGRTVTAYHKLPNETLFAEGWKTLIVEQPPELQEGYNAVMYYEQDGTTIYRKWRLEPIEEQL
jgi:hypothetical protein